MNLRETQEALEQQWLDTGCLKYKHVYSQVNFSDTQVGSYIFGKILSDLEAAIKEFLKDVNLRTDYQRAVFLCLTPLDIATLVLKTTMDVCFSGVAGFRTAKSSNCISSLSITLGQRLISHFNFVTLRKKNPQAYDHMMEYLEGKSRATRYSTLRWYKRTMLETEVVAPPDALASIGYPLLRMTIETSGLFEVIPKIVGTHMVQAVVPTPEVITSVMSNVNRLAAMHPVYLPMVIPPEPWTSWDQGGYLTLPTLAITHQRDVARRLYDSGHLQPRLETLNRLGSVAWEINKEILQIQLEAYSCNHRSVPVSDIGVALPTKPWKSSAEYRALETTRPDVIKEWKTQAGRIYTEFFTRRCVGQRLAFLRNLSIARKFEQYEAIWFPYRMDYRGRCYSIASGLSPQGNDFARSLLRFHQKTPLSPNDGAAWGWYLVQGANLMGVDKVPFPERQAFVRQNHENILASAREPLNNQWWLKADKPWVMLAWCLEYKAITSGEQSYTQLPVNRDGRCNGLQHLAAAVRDRETAQLVSLVPLDKPSDIYTRVLEEVNKIIPEDSFWHGKVNRKLVKRNTMTTPYNVTQRGMGEQILEEILATSERGMLTGEDKRHARELQGYNYDTIMGLLGRTSELMRWYRAISEEYMASNTEMSWVLPDGFRVIQHIPKSTVKKLMLERKTVVINYRVPTKQHDRRRNLYAFSPNVTHSMDATHLAMVLRRLPEDVPFVAIHDSYGMPAPYVARHESLIVHTFADLYDTFDILWSIAEDYRQKFKREPAAQPPELGVLTMDEVRGATYAFA